MCSIDRRYNVHWDSVIKKNKFFIRNNVIIMSSSKKIMFTKYNFITIEYNENVA